MIKTTWRSKIFDNTEIAIISDEQGNAIAPYSVTGDAAEVVSYKLGRAFNADGHPLGLQCDAWHMDSALSKGDLEFFEFKVVESENAIVQPEPLPKYAVS